MIRIGKPENGEVRFEFDILGLENPLIIESTVYRFPNNMLDALIIQYRENRTTCVALGSDSHTRNPVIYLHGKKKTLG